MADITTEKRYTAREPMALPNKGYIAAGETLIEGDPRLKGRLHLFDVIEVVISTGVEDTSADPGKKRTRAKPKATPKTKAAANG